MAGIGGIGSGGVGGIGLPQDRGGIKLRLDGEANDSFSDTLKNALGEVSQLQTDARDAIGAFVRGEPVEIHEVMAATEEAGIALDMLIEIRNKLADAYRTVTQMQG